jgi:hypothetical protein
MGRRPEPVDLSPPDRRPSKAIVPQPESSPIRGAERRQLNEREVEFPSAAPANKARRARWFFHPDEPQAELNPLFSKGSVRRRLPVAEKSAFIGGSMGSPGPVGA